MKLIKFFAQKEFLKLGKPIPIKQVVPEWYRQAESMYSTMPDGEKSAGLKKCMPYMDTLIAGYALTIPVDIYVFEDEQGNPKFSWNGPSSISDFIKERPKQLGETMPRPAGHYDNHLVFSGFWGWKTPKGYSTLVVHPLNRYDLPFTISAGIIDSDGFNAPGNIPFFLQKGFNGTIPAGTPFAQVIPIKRKSWLMVDDSKGMADVESLQGPVIRKKGTLYKNLFWKRKEYK